MERLMHMSVDGIPISDFDPHHAIEEWWSDTTRSRQPYASKHKTVTA